LPWFDSLASCLREGRASRSKRSKFSSHVVIGIEKFRNQNISSPIDRPSSFLYLVSSSHWGKVHCLFNPLIVAVASARLDSLASCLREGFDSGIPFCFIRARRSRDIRLAFLVGMGIGGSVQVEYTFEISILLLLLFFCWR
jgi:hypothetical protein